MGVTGVEGPFRRCAERALQVLREEKDVILTLLEVLRHDPLYTFALSPIRARKVQLSESHVANDDDSIDEWRKRLKNDTSRNAERALLGVRSRLDPGSIYLFSVDIMFISFSLI